LLRLYASDALFEAGLQVVSVVVALTICLLVARSLPLPEHRDGADVLPVDAQMLPSDVGIIDSF